MLKSLLILLFVFSCAQLPGKRNDKLSILQGVTNTSSVEFSVLTPNSMKPRFELRTAEGEILVPEEVKTVTRDFSDYTVHKFIFTRDQKKDFNLYVFDGDKIVDQRLVGKGQAEDAKLNIAVGSCMDDHFSESFKIWDAMARRNPEYLLLIGDNVYADKIDHSGTSIETNPEVLWKRYIDVRLTLPLYFQEKLIPVHALWDDHDYGGNNSGKDYKYKDQSKEIFTAFMAQDLSDDEWEKGYGVGGLLSLGSFNLYFLDARYFRDPSKDGTQLGQEQYNWLQTKLKEESTPSLIIEGDQFFGGYHRFESYEGNHPQEFLRFVDDLKKITTPFVFISGDRHMSEIMQFPRALFGKPSFEITSSPIHAHMFPGNSDENPWRVVANQEKHNFTMIQNVAQDDHWFLNVENIGESGDVIYRREIAVFIKDLQNNLNEVRKRRRMGRRRYRRARRRRH
jgi:alkaline phosphatase D